MIKLVVKEGALDQREFYLKEGDNILGREMACDVCLNSSGVSRRHAKISLMAHGLVIADLASANGVFVNGVQIQEKELHHGDIISFSNIALEVVSQPQTATFDLGSDIPQPERQPENLSFFGKLKNSFHKDVEPSLNKVLKSVSLSAIYGALFLGFLVFNLFFTLGPTVSESQSFLKSEALKRGNFLVTRLADLNERAVREKDTSRMEVSMIDESEGVISATIVRPFIDSQGQLGAEIIAPIHRATAMDLQETWQKKSLGKVKKGKYIAAAGEVFIHEIDSQRILFSKPIFETVDGEQTVAAFGQVTLGVPGLEINSSAYWGMFMKALLAALFLGFIFAFLVQKLTQHHLGLLYSSVSSQSAADGNLIHSPVKYQPIEKVVSAINETLDAVKSKASLSSDMPQESYDKQKLEAVLQVSKEGLGILDFSNRVISNNNQFENLLMIQEGGASYQNIIDDQQILNGVLDLVKSKTGREIQMTRSDGRTIEVRASFVKDSRGSVEFVVLSIAEVNHG